MPTGSRGDPRRCCYPRVVTEKDAPPNSTAAAGRAELSREGGRTAEPCRCLCRSRGRYCRRRSASLPQPPASSPINITATHTRSAGKGWTGKPPSTLAS
nr:hypothetical protein Iba_chr13eCG10600 [Ipomoea batatas]